MENINAHWALMPNGRRVKSGANLNKSYRTSREVRPITLVGDAGFEPTTSRPPAVRATTALIPDQNVKSDLRVASCDLETSSLKTSFQEKLSLQTATGSFHPSPRALAKLSYTLANTGDKPTVFPRAPAK